MTDSPTPPSGGEAAVPGHEEWDEYAAGYALDALSADEAEAFTAHLAGCPACQASVDELTLVTAQLGTIAHPSDESVAPSWESVRAHALAADRGDELAARRQRRVGRVRPMLAAAASVVVLAAGGILAWQLSTPSSTQVAGPVAACRASDGCDVVHLTTTRGSTVSDAADVLVRGQSVSVVPVGLAAAASGRQYVLWQLPGDSRPVPVSEFTATGDAATGRASLMLPVSDTAAFAVSVEHAGAIPEKPTTVVALGSTT